MPNTIFKYSILATLFAAEGVFSEELNVSLVSLEALYWYTNETVDWAFVLSKEGNLFQNSYQTFVFDWAPGFSLRFGYPLGHDDWKMQASYTWFQSKASGHVEGNVTPGFLAARLSLLEPFSSGKASLQIHYNMFDWDMRREIPLSRRAYLRPFIGLKGGWIDQLISSHWTRPSNITASEDLEQHFWAAGAKMGASMLWETTFLHRHSLSLAFRWEADYLWGHWRVSDKFSYNLSHPIYLKTTPRNFGSWVFSSSLGWRWEYLFKSCQRPGLSLDYEIEDWLNQCQWFTDISGSQNNDLTLQGLRLGLNASF